MPEIGIGLLGVGWMGQLHSASYRRVRDHYPACQGTPRLVIAADASQERARAASEELGYESWTADWREVLAHPEVDAVSITAPNFLHLEMALAAAEDTRFASHLISPDALALVRFGVRAADDPRICDTAKVIDALLKVETPSGLTCHRYNDDGYGEHDDGRGEVGHAGGDRSDRRVGPEVGDPPPPLAQPLARRTGAPLARPTAC